MRKFGLVIAIAAIGVGGIATTSSADLLNTRPITPVDIGFEDSLQEIFDALQTGCPGGCAGPALDAVADQSPIALFEKTAGSPTASFIIELTAGAGTQTFGLYNRLDSSKQATIFDGASTSGDQATVAFNFGTGDVLVTITDVSAGTSSTTTYFDVFGDGTGAEFGFVLNGNKFTEDSLNGGAARALVFQGNDSTELNLPFIGPGTFDDSEFIFAWEDGTDNDFQDMVVLVQSIAPIPAPGALVLGVMGIGLVGWVRRRYR